MKNFTISKTGTTDEKLKIGQPDLKRILDELATSFSLLEATLESTADGILVADNNGKIVRFNKKFAVLWRIPEAVLATKDDDKALSFVLDQLVNPESFIAKVRELYAQHSMVSFDVLDFKDGRTFERYSQPQTINGKYVGRVWSFRDITERKKAEEVLRQSEERYHSLAEVAHVGIFHTDANGDTTYVNPSWSIITGLSGEDALGQSWLKAVHKDDVKEIIKGWHKAVKMQQVSFSEFRFVRPDGSIAWVMGQAIPERDADNKIMGYVGTITDITERKKAEEEKTRLLNTIQKSLDEIYVFNTGDFHFQYANDGALKNLGYTTEELFKLTPLDIKPEMTFEKVMELISPLLKNEKEKIVFETIHKRKDRSTYPVEVHMQLISEGEKKIFLAITRDITERKKAEEEIKKSQHDLRNLSAHLHTIREEEGARIAREVHDELGQQLTGIKMDATWISKKIGVHDKMVHDKIDDMIQLIDDTVKTVRRIASALRPGILDDVGLNATLEWQCSEFAKRAEVKCSFESRMNDTDIEKNIATGIFRVCQEALNNITRHAKAAQAEVTIERKKDKILLTIADNGIGFDVGESKSKNTLGLIGMKERAIMLGGELIIESVKGKGTLLILKLPVRAMS